MCVGVDEWKWWCGAENGNVKFTVMSKMGNGELGMGNGEKPDSFFFRVKMK